MKYLSICSGIEAASVAWEPLGWEPLAFSEIEAFPRAVLAHHYPSTPLHGDFTLLKDDPSIVDADLLCGGTPCQAFSVAGLRQSLADDRGNLTLQFVLLADAIDHLRRDAGREPAWILWENVPGVLSTSDNAFGSFLGGLVGRSSPIPEPADGWTGAGVVDGPTRCAAWRVLDAQHFGLAQRRKRVFVLARGGAGRWAVADALLPIIEGSSWHPAPGRPAREGVAPTISARTKGGGGLGTDFDCDGGLIPRVSPTLKARDYKGPSSDGDGDGAPLLPVSCDVAMPLRAGRQYSDMGDGQANVVVAHSLRADGFAASEDGTGRGTPLVPVAFSIMPMNSGSDYKARETDVAQPLMAGGPVGGNQGGDYIVQPVAFSCKDHGADAGEVAPTLRSMGHDDSHANGGGQVAVAFAHQAGGKQTTLGYSDDGTVQTLGANQTPAVMTLAIRGRDGGHDLETRSDGTANAVLTPSGGRAGIGVGAVAIQAGALRENPTSGPDGVGVQRGIAYTLEARAEVQAVAFAQNQRDEVRQMEVAGTLASESGMKQQTYLQQAMQVRRLTPRECERLQGFPDDFTLIPVRGKPAADGPRYKALGNSMAVNVMAWIGQRIASVNAIADAQERAA